MAELKVMKRCPDYATLNDTDSLFCMHCRCDLSSIAPETIREETTDSFFEQEIDSHENRQDLESPKTEMYEGIIPPVKDSESMTEEISHTTSSIPVIPPINEPQPKKDFKKYYIYGAAAVLMLAAGIGLMFFMNREQAQISAYDSHIEQGQKYVAEKKYEAAIDEFEQARKIDPKKEQAYENLYYTYEKQGDIKQQQFIYNEYNYETGKTQKDMQEAQKEIYVIIVQPEPIQDSDNPVTEEPPVPETYDEDAPILEQWENVTDWKAFETSKEYAYEIRWSAVNEAEGYELNYVLEKDTSTELTEDITDTTFNVKFKDYAGLIGKVRAYKTVNGERLYTPWSVIQSKDQNAVKEECNDLNPNLELTPVIPSEPETDSDKTASGNTTNPKEDLSDNTGQKEETADPSDQKKEESIPSQEDKKEEQTVNEPVDQLPKDITIIELLDEVNDLYVFSNGLGWSTEIEIEEDGTLKGYYHYETMDGGEEYQVTRHECRFTGKIKNIKKVKEGVYTADFEEYENEYTPGQQIIEEGTAKVRLVYDEKAYGFDNCRTLTFYAPGTSVMEFTDEQKEYLPDQNMSGDEGWMLNNEDNYLMWGKEE